MYFSDNLVAADFVGLTILVNGVPATVVANGSEPSSQWLPNQLGLATQHITITGTSPTIITPVDVVIS